MGKFLADTTIIVDHLRGDKKAKDFLLNEEPFVSLVTLAELIQGVSNKRELKAAQEAISDLTLISITEDLSAHAVELMKSWFLSHDLQFLDALIAATAIKRDLQLITANTKHFKFIKELKVVDWENLV